MYLLINPNSEFMNLMEWGYELCGIEYSYLIDLEYLHGFSTVSKEMGSYFCSCFCAAVVIGAFAQFSTILKTFLSPYLLHPLSCCLHFQTKKIISGQLYLWEASFSSSQVKNYGLNTNKYTGSNYRCPVLFRGIWWWAMGFCVVRNYTDCWAPQKRRGRQKKLLSGELESFTHVS